MKEGEMEKGSYVLWFDQIGIEGVQKAGGIHAFWFGFIIELGDDAMERAEFGTGKPVVPHQLGEDDPVRPIMIAFDKRMKARYKVGTD